MNRAEVTLLRLDVDHPIGRVVSSLAIALALAVSIAEAVLRLGDRGDRFRQMGAVSRRRVAGVLAMLLQRIECHSAAAATTAASRNTNVVFIAASTSFAQDHERSVGHLERD